MYSIDSITSVKNAISDSYGECEQGLTNNKDLMFMVIYMHVGIDMIVWAVRRYAGKSCTKNLNHKALKVPLRRKIVDPI